MKKRAVGYCRISTLMQVDNTSLKDQEEKIRMYAKLHDIVIDEMFIDKAVSGKSTDRPEYDKMMDYIKENDIDMIIVYKNDRIHRSLYNLLAPILANESPLDLNLNISLTILASSSSISNLPSLVTLYPKAGLPPTHLFSLSLAILPFLVLSLITALSNSAKLPSICKNNIPWGVDVSNISVTLTNATSYFWSS